MISQGQPCDYADCPHPATVAVRNARWDDDLLCERHAGGLPGQRWSALYGGTPGTVDVLPAVWAGGPVRHWFTHDRDPGIGPMAYEAGAGIVLLELLRPVSS
jgi:hypothetical protein